MRNYFFMILIFLSFIVGCQKEANRRPSEEVDFRVSLKISLNPDQLNDLEFRNENESYSFTTTGTDPYVYSDPLSKSIEDDCVLTFDYISSENFSLQLFFSPPTEEVRSIKDINVENSANWKSFSIDVKEQMGRYDWGNNGDLLRIDLGDKKGVDIKLKNIRFRSRNKEEEEAAQKREDFLQNDLELSEAISEYLDSDFPAHLSSVNVLKSDVVIQGSIPTGDDDLFLLELMPGVSLFDLEGSHNAIPISENNFEIKQDRMGKHDGVQYDRLLSRWVIIEKTQNGSKMLSHVHYADVVEPKWSMPKSDLPHKKGLGGFNKNQFVDDLDDLGIGSVTVNVPITTFLHLNDPGNATVHEYQGRTYYIDNQIIASMDETFRTASDRDIIVSAIILVNSAAESADPKVGELLEHPEFTPGDNVFYTMPRLDNIESVNCYAAALDFLTNRYCQPGSPNGRIHHFIMHNEVDQGVTWTNMGKDRPVEVYLQNYYESMRIAYNVLREYDENGEVLASFTHSWNEPTTGGDYFSDGYSTLNMLNGLLKYSSVEGDFQWGLACHPYPQDLNEPRVWEDQKARFSRNSPLVTFKNLEVLDDWIWREENMYKGREKRTLFLSENGTNSRTYEVKDLTDQAAGFAYAWKKLKNLDGIDAIQWHNWIDNRHEFGLRIGLRKFPDDEEDPGGPKPVWYAYQAAGTDREDEVFEPYKEVIGIGDWEEIMMSVSK